MQLITKIFLFILSSLCLFFLVFFTFIVPSIDSTINLNYEYTQTGNYIIQGEYPDYQIEVADIGTKNTSGINMRNISLGNNIYYTDGNIEEKGENELYLSEGTYYFNINSLDFNKTIRIEGAAISTDGPGDFIISTQHKIQKSIFSISSKVEISLFHPTSEPSKGTLLDIYPNMLIMYDPALNKQIINADLLRIQNVQHLDMINSPLYTQKINDAGDEYYELHKDIQNYVFFNNEDNYNFIKKIFNFKNFQEKKYKTDFINLTQNNFYNFPGEKYIIQYYSYFQNKEKKKVYYKNIILKELVSMINSKTNGNNDKIENIIEKTNLLKQDHPDDYKLILKTINHYYENILFSQYSSPAVLLQFSKLHQKLNNTDIEFKFISLLTLRNIYSRYHNENIIGFHRLLNSFIDQHEMEMNMSIYDENHRIHNYFLFFLKNILVSDFSKVEDHNDVILLFKKYIDIKSVFIEKGNDTTKKTALFDNATLLKVFINITKLNFFEEKLDDKGLLVPLNPAKITNENYKILYENLNKLLDFHKQYQNFIDNSDNRKDKILTFSYKKYTEDLKEYFLALDDYNQYILEYDSAAKTPVFVNDNIQGLVEDDAVKYLKQFVGVSSLNTLINIRDYGYCVQPIEANDIPVKNEKDGFCFKIENLIISGFNFSFILTPSDNNTISHLKYTNIEGEKTEVSTNYVMDHIEEDMLRKFSASQSKEKDRFDFRKFFINTFINKNDFIPDDKNDKNEDKNEFIPPDNSSDTLQVRTLKRTLLGDNGYLKQIRNILPITYDYLIIKRENDEYIVNIFPTNFSISVTSGFAVNVFKGKFSGEYSYGSKDADNTFTDVSLLIQNPKNLTENSFLLNKVPIDIDGKFMTKDTTDILTKILFPYSKIENIYMNLYEKYSTEDITITYQLNHNNIDFTISNGYHYIYDMQSQVEIYKNTNRLSSITYNKLKNYLETLQ